MKSTSGSTSYDPVRATAPAFDGPEQVSVVRIIIDPQKLSRFGRVYTDFVDGKLEISLETPANGKPLFTLSVDPAAGLSDHQIDGLNEKLGRFIMLNTLV